MKFFQGWLDKLWELAATRGAEKVLMGVSFTEAIFFPVPPDLLLIPMGLARREKVFRLAFICLAASLVGGIAGYVLGYFFMQVLGFPILKFYGLMDKYALIQNWYEQYSAWAVALAGLTPIPYKLCTLTAGAFKINWPIFVLASTLSRGLRFYAIAGLIYWQGERARYFLEKRFDLILCLTIFLVVLGFLLLKFTQLSELQKMLNLFSRLQNNLEKIFHFPETI